jgi:2'-5' RNA ligase
MTRTLFTLAYPTLSVGDRAVLDGYRSKHDLPKSRIVRPHFTMVFGLSDQDEAAYMGHVETVAAKETAISFHCRYATLGAGSGDEPACVFLVPEGNSAILNLHDRLHTGMLAASLRLDLQYVPHITIGTCTAWREAKILCDEINAHAISMPGTIEALTVAVLESDELRDLSSFALRQNP